MNVQHGQRFFAGFKGVRRMRWETKEVATAKFVNFAVENRGAASRQNVIELLCDFVEADCGLFVRLDPDLIGRAAGFLFLRNQRCDLIRAEFL